MNSSLICERAICEGQNWLVGAPGRCQNSTRECSCPPGYSGNYILSANNDCHMTDAFREVTNTVTFSTALCALLVSTIVFCKVVKETLCMYGLKVVPFQHDSTSYSTGRKPRPSQTRLMKRKRLVMTTLGLLVLFAVCELQRSAVLLDNAAAYAVELPLEASFTYGVGRFALCAAIFQFFYIYTTSLPQSEQLEAVLGRRFNAMQYRRTITWAFKYNGVMCAFVSTVLTWLHTAQLSPWFTHNFVVTQLVMQLCIAVDMHVVIWLVYFMNVPRYRKIIKHCSQHKSIPKLRSGILRCQVCIAVGPPGIVFMSICIYLTVMDSRFNFVLFTHVAINQHMLCLLGGYLLGWDFISMGKDKPDEKSKVAHSTTMMTSL